VLTLSACAPPQFDPFETGSSIEVENIFDGDSRLESANFR